MPKEQNVAAKSSCYHHPATGLWQSISASADDILHDTLDVWPGKSISVLEGLKLQLSRSSAACPPLKAGDSRAP